MQFLNPLLLLGTLGIAVPVVIHLLNRYRYRQVDWGAMELLRRALVVRSRRIRLEDLLLLALRCLAVLLLALALARPVLTPAGTPGLGGQGGAGAVIAVDVSFSMDHRPGVQSRFDRAAERVRDVLKTLPPGSPTSLVLLGDQPRILLNNVGYDADRFEEALKNAAPLPERLNLEVGLEKVHEFLREMTAPSKECYLVTDAQLSTWGQLSARSRQTLGEMAAAGRVFFLPVASDQTENLALTRFELASGELRTGVPVRFEAEVSNPGIRPRENVSVSLYVNDASVAQGVIERLEPGRSQTVSLRAGFNREGVVRLAARLGPDELTADNARHLVADVRGRPRVLYASAPSAEAPRGGKDYLLTALRPNEAEGLPVDAVSWLDLPKHPLANYRVVVLANVPDLADEQLSALYHYVRQGGGLIVFLGDNVQPALFNARMRQEKEPLAPADLVEVVTKAEDRPTGWAVEPADHPLARVLAPLPSEEVAEARVMRWFRLRPGEGSRSVLKVSGRDEPLVVERPLGRGRVVLFAAAAEEEWTNMVFRPPLYPLLLRGAVTYLSRQAHERPLTVSQPLVVPLPVSEERPVASVTFRDPKERTFTAPPVSRDGQTLAEVAVADQPGFYEVRYADTAPPLFAAVNVDAGESDLRGLNGDLLTEAFQGLSLRVVPEGENLEAVVRESRVGRELWKELLAAALVVLVLEGFLAWWFTRRAAAARAAPGGISEQVPRPRHVPAGVRSH